MAKMALITRSTGGLGSCFVEIHASAGGDLILVGRGQVALDRQAAEVSEKYGVTAHTIAVDLSKAEDVQRVYDTRKERLGGRLPY